jgi:hypothetical protein
MPNVINGVTFAICQRTPIPFKDWWIDVQFSARGAESGGEVITFLSSDTVFPQPAEQFNGFQITFETAHTDE